jgi:hypothetical protein
VEKFLGDLELSKLRPVLEERIQGKVPSWIPPQAGLMKINGDGVKEFKLRCCCGSGKEFAGVFLEPW